MATSALIYARISKLDANVPKVAQQLANLRQLAEQRGYTVTGEYADDGLSAAKAENRPDFDRLLGDLPKHPGAVILATEEARLARNNAEKQSLTFSCIAAGVRWETLRDGIVDPSEPAGEFMAVIRGAVDTLESQRKAQRQRQANANRRASGLPATNGIVPFGWNADRVTLCEPEAEMVRVGTRMILEGASIYAVREYWKSTGVQSHRSSAWTSGGIKTILLRWRNAAIVSYHDEPLGPGQWEPIVSEGDLRKCRTILSRNNSEKKALKFVLSGIAKCACGSVMISNGATPPRYVCRALVNKNHDRDQKHASIKGDWLEDEVRLTLAMKYLVVPDAGALVDAEASELASLYEDLSKVGKKLSELADDYYGDEPILTRSQFIQKNTELKKREGDLQARVENLAARSAHAAMLTNARSQLHAGNITGDATHVLHELYDRYDALSMEEKRTLIRSQLQVTVLPGRTGKRIVIHDYVLDD